MISDVINKIVGPPDHEDVYSIVMEKGVDPKEDTTV